MAASRADHQDPLGCGRGLSWRTCEYQRCGRETVLTLHGPNDSGAILAWDDDRGKGLNARIVRKLQPGSYWLSVRHKDPTKTGTYTIGVKKQ